MTELADIPPGLEALTFRHLQLHPKHVEALERSRLFCLGDLKKCSIQNLEKHIKAVSAVEQNLNSLRKAVRGGRINWPAFWNSPLIEIHWLAMLSHDFDYSEDLRHIPLDSLEQHFGALVRIPRAAGFRSLGELIAVFQEGIRPWRGFGSKKALRLGTKLFEMAKNRNPMVEDPIAVVEDPDVNTSLPEAILAWDVEALGLKGKVASLRKNGLANVGSVVEKLPELHLLPSLGRGTAKKVKDRINLLRSSLIDGKLNLDKLAETTGSKIIPHYPDCPGERITEALRALIESVAAEDPSEVAPLIAEFRLCKLGSDAASHAAIGRLATERITRQRVFQVERRILNNIFFLLRSPFPVIGETVVRPILKEKFQRLALALAERDEIGPAELGIVIASEWSCSREEALRVLPTVMAILEGTARGSAEISRLGDTPPAFLDALEGVIGLWSVQNVGAERALCKMFDECGLTTLEELRLAWIEGRKFGKHEEFVKTVLSEACSENRFGSNFAERLAQSAQQTLIPTRSGDWSVYVASIREDVSTLIENGTFQPDARLIFDIRTSALPNERPTLERLGTRLDRLGVTIKQIETETLKRLASALLFDAEGYVQCVLRPDWLKMWREMKKVHDRFPGDHKSFRRSIEDIFDLEEKTLTIAMPTIWAILSGLPTRKIYGKSKAESTAPAALLAPVKLQGFRAVH